MKNRLFLLFSGLFLLIFPALQAQVNPEITTKALREEIHFLASDSLKGRKPGTPEETVAAKYSASASLTANSVFAGYGFDINLDSLKWNDYAGIDAKGNWVLVLRGDPEMEKQSSAFIAFEQERSKVLTTSIILFTQVIQYL